MRSVSSRYDLDEIQEPEEEKIGRRGLGCPVYEYRISFLEVVMGLQKPKYWQFSIREFLLIVIAVSCLIAFYTNQRNFERTRFSRSFDPNLTIEIAMKKLGVTAEGGAGGGGSSGSRRVSMSYRSTYRNVEGATQSQLLEEIRKTIEQQVLDSGCEIRGTGLSGKLVDETFYEFDTEYKNANANGQIRVRATKGESADWQFWIDIFEY